MKKILLFAFSLLSLNGYTQNIEYFKKIRNLDKSELENTAKEIAGFLRGEYEITKKEETESGYYYISFVKLNSSENELANNAFNVVFKKFFEGKNEALEIEGTEKYSFYEVTYNYLDLFPYWQKYFVEKADKEQTAKDLKLQRSEYKEDKIWWLYKFQQADNSKKWTLRMFY